MTPLSIQSGWWVSTDERFVCCYNTKEEAIAHIEYQRNVMKSQANWYFQYIKMTFGELKSFPYKPTK